jgi:predicted methyltransferase
MRQPEHPQIEWVTEGDEQTLYIDGAQAMQAWEEELMHISADLLCEYGDTFLEVGLGMGFSALRIASHPGTRRHTVVEKYQPVIDLFLARHEGPLPESLHVVHADIFEYVEALAPESLDGIFFDPEFPSPQAFDDPQVLAFYPRLFRALRPGGAFIPFFSVEPVLKERYLPFFSKIVVLKRSFEAYPDTNYTYGVTEGEAFIQCFVKEEE